jgi:hypothetical protein
MRLPEIGRKEGRLATASALSSHFGPQKYSGQAEAALNQGRQSVVLNRQAHAASNITGLNLTLSRIILAPSQALWMQEQACVLGVRGSTLWKRQRLTGPPAGACSTGRFYAQSIAWGLMVFQERCKRRRPALFVAGLPGAVSFGGDAR